MLKREFIVIKIERGVPDMIASLKENKIIKKTYTKFQEFTKAYFPVTRAKLAYYISYGEKCNLEHPKTFSEKLLWLSLNTYRNNPVILQLSDKYLVRDYVKEKVGEDILNELYCVWEATDDINIKDLPNSFALKVSQGCKTNIFCSNKEKLDLEHLKDTLEEWDSGQYLYDKMMADIGGVQIKELKKYYICEKYLYQEGQEAPIDYKIYCFNGEPKAILVIGDRFSEKKGVFMTPNWEFLAKLKGKYKVPEKMFDKPNSLNKMIDIAKKLSAPFPFVRVDLYDIDGKPVFGELTFFPNGCINMQETHVDSISMGEHLDISKELIKIKPEKISK